MLCWECGLVLVVCPRCVRRTARLVLGDVSVRGSGIWVRIARLLGGAYLRDVVTVCGTMCNCRVSATVWLPCVCIPAVSLGVWCAGVVCLCLCKCDYVSRVSVGL